jgi:YD repeat-containing protein
MVAKTNEATGVVTSYTYDAVGRRLTATESTTRHLDGKTRSVTGTGVVPRFYRYGVNHDGSQWTTVFIGKEDSPRWEKTTRDLSGRVLRVEKPGFEGVETTRNSYDNRGQLVRKETPGRTATLYQYDALGHPTMTGLDVDGDGRLTPASMDRIALSKVAFRQIDDAWWQESHR